MIGVTNISKAYKTLKVIENFSIEFEKGKISCIFGASGSGKTTLLNILTGITKMDSGQRINLEDKRFSYVFQEDRLLPFATAKQNLMFVLEDRYDKKEAEERAKKYVEVVGLARFMDSYPHELSGGMQRRVSFARALAYEGDVLILDEPFKGLDQKLKKSLIEFVKSYLKKDDAYVILVTHDMQEAVTLSDCIYKVNGPELKIVEKIIVDEAMKEQVKEKMLLIDKI